MAIAADSAIVFFGTQGTVTTSTAAVSDGAMSAQEDTWTNDDDAPLASIVFSGTYSVAPTASSAVDLFARLLNIQSTSDADTPDSNLSHVYLGSFPLNDVTSAQYVAIDVYLPNTVTSQQYEFYIKNNAGQTLSAGWNLYVTPKTYGPHPA